MKKLLPLILVMTSCTTMFEADVYKKKDGIYTLRYYTGSLGKDLYVASFAKKAEKLCPSGYKVIEKSFTPSTLDGLKLETNHFYWVIKCELK